MRVFTYDGTFEGVLSAVFDAYMEKVFPDLLLVRGDILPLMVSDARDVATGQDKVERVFRALEKKLSPFALAGLLYAALADDAAGALVVFRAIRVIFDSPGLVENDLGNADMLALSQLARKVGAEKQHLLGFARFQKTAQGVYFAAMEPRYDVLPLMVAHFCDRFADQQWALYDARRGYGIFFDGADCREMFMDGKWLAGAGLAPELLADDEEQLQRLWKGYFAAASVAERVNPRLQARCLPRRFWKYLPEKQS